MLSYIILGLIYVPLLLLGLMFCYFKAQKWIKRGKRCTNKIQVVVIEILSKRIGRGGLAYKPVFKVCSIKKDIIIDSALYTNIYSFEVGQVLWIHVNPNNMQDFMFESPYKDIIMLVDGLGCILPLVGILLSFVLLIK